MREKTITEAVAGMQNGQMRTIELEDDHQVLVSRIDDNWFAIYGKCSHYGAPLAKGALSGHRVVCPWHHACFDARTGTQLEGPGVESLPQYEILERDGEIILHIPDADSMRSTCPAHLHSHEEGHEKTYVIVGGGAAALYAAEGMRRARFRGRIVMISKEEALPYDRTKASKAYLEGKAEDDGMPLLSEDFFEKYDIELRRGVSATQLDPEQQQVRLSDGGTLTYDKILIATGSTPRPLPVPGADLDGVFTLRTWADAKTLRERAESAERVVVIGASFIGLEAAQALQKHDCRVTVVAPEKIPFSEVFGEEIGQHIARLHSEAGIELRLPAKVASITGAEGRVTGVVLESGKTLPADLVVVGIGVKPATDWLPDELTDDKGAIEVDDQLSYSPTLYAAGDVAKFPLNQQKVRIEHWKVAADQGRAAGRIMADDSTTYNAIPFFWSAQQGKNFRYVGHAEDWDTLHIDGTVADNDFLAYYGKSGTIQAVLGVGRDAAVAAIQELMYEGRMVGMSDVEEGWSVSGQLA